MKFFKFFNIFNIGKLKELVALEKHAGFTKLDIEPPPNLMHYVSSHQGHEILIYEVDGKFLSYRAFYKGDRIYIQEVDNYLHNHDDWEVMGGSSLTSRVKSVRNEAKNWLLKNGCSIFRDAKCDKDYEG